MDFQFADIYIQSTVEEAQYFITGTITVSTNVLQIQFLLEISPALKGEVQFDPICFKKLDCESTKLKRYLHIGICTVTKFYEGRQSNLASSKVDSFFLSGNTSIFIKH